MKKSLTIIIFGIMVVYTVVTLLTVAVDREHMRQCLVWQEQSLEYPLFYLSENNQAGCDNIGVSIDAPFAPAK